MFFERILHLKEKNEANEVLNYDVCQNELWDKQEQKFESKKKNEIFVRFFVTAQIAFSVGLLGAIIHCLVHKTLKYKYSILLQALEEYKNDIHLFFIYWLFLNLLPAMLSGLIVVFLEPIVKGSAIPILKRYLNGIYVPSLFSIRILICKVISMVLSMVSGLAGGNEGPMFHLGAIVGAEISDNKYLTLNNRQKFCSGTDRRDFIFFGISTAITTCFASPLAGILVVLEEISNFWNKILIWRMLFVSCFGLFIMNFFVSLFTNHTFTFPLFSNIVFYEFATQKTIYHLPVYILIGITGAIFGSLWNELHKTLISFRSKYVTTNSKKLIEIVVVTLITNTLGFLIMITNITCKKHTMDKEFQMVQFWCEEGSYSRSLIYFFSSPAFIVHEILDDVDSFETKELIIFFLYYFLMSGLTHGLHVTLGIYIPNMLLGSIWGQIFVKILRMILPKKYIPAINYSVFGVCAQMGGVFRMIISTIAIIMETSETGVTLVFPIIIILCVSTWIADQFNLGIYEIPNVNVPILTWDFGNNLAGKQASNIMSTPVICLRVREKVSYVLEILNETKPNGFPIVDVDRNGDRSSGYFVGLITRQQITAILNGSLYYDNKKEWISDITLEKFYALKQQKFVSKNFEDNEQFEEIKKKTIDFRMFLNPHAYRVGMNYGTFGVFTNFRGLCLTYLVVVNDNNQVRGILTRTNFLNEEEHIPICQVIKSIIFEEND